MTVRAAPLFHHLPHIRDPQCCMSKHHPIPSSQRIHWVSRHCPSRDLLHTSSLHLVIRHQALVRAVSLLQTLSLYAQVGDDVKIGLLHACPQPSQYLRFLFGLMRVNIVSRRDLCVSLPQQDYHSHGLKIRSGSRFAMSLSHRPKHQVERCSHDGYFLRRFPSSSLGLCNVQLARMRQLLVMDGLARTSIITLHSWLLLTRRYVIIPSLASLTRYLSAPLPVPYRCILFGSTMRQRSVRQQRIFLCLWSTLSSNSGHNGMSPSLPSPLMHLESLERQENCCLNVSQISYVQTVMRIRSVIF